MIEIPYGEPSHVMRRVADAAGWGTEDRILIAEKYIERQGDDPEAIMAECGSGDDAPETRLEVLLNYISRNYDNAAFRKHIKFLLTSIYVLLYYMK